MEKTRVISRSNLPTNSPLVSSAVAYLLLDKFNASGWVWGVVITIFAILWIYRIMAVFFEKQIEVFHEEKKLSQTSFFGQKLQDLSKK